MGKIILARHGQDGDNAKGILNGRRNSLLTSKGMLQAFELTRELMKARLNIEHIFSSPLQRAEATAIICAETLDIPYTILECLIERNHGILEGHPYADIPLLAKSWREKNGFIYVVEVEGGESYPGLCERAKGALLEIKSLIHKLNIRGNTLVISHGAISRAIEAVHKGMTPEEMFEQLTSFSNCEFRVLE
jgi:broad specificity phosphatase PhoE